jgi:transposase-like protein
MHSPEKKAAVMAALLAGQGVDATARQYKISKATVSRWKSELGNERMEQIETKKRETMDELLLDYLRETLTTLQVQAIHFRDQDWLAEQSASELAVLHGVQTDKAIRLLEALESAGGDAGPGVEPAQP